MSHEHSDTHHCHGAHEHCECCQGEICGVCHHHHQKHEDFSHELIELADEAWMEVLYEKIKKQVEANSGANLDKLAKLVADSNQARWKNKMGANKATTELKDKLSEFFSK